MFSTQMKAVFYILAQAFMRLYNLSADWQPSDEHEELTGTDVLDAAAAAFAGVPAAAQVGHGPDNPEVGTSMMPAPINSPAQVFAAVNSEPIYTMTDLAQGFTREQYLAGEGWTDELLVSAGIMTVAYPEPVAPPAAPALPKPPTPPAAPSAPTNTSAPASPTAVDIDADGLAWDARIHSGAKTKTTKNVWTKRKGVPDATYNTIRAELMQRGGAAPFVPQQVPHAPLAPPAAPVAPAPAVVPQPPATPGAPNPAQAAIAQAQAAAAAGGVPTNGTELIRWASTNNLGRLFAATAAHVGLASFGMISQPANDGLVPIAYEFMVANKG